MSWSRRQILSHLGWVLGASLIFSGGLATGAYRTAIDDSRRRLLRKSKIVRTSLGRVEFAVAGRGAPLLMLHGTGGGFDQGLIFGAGLMQRGFQVIAPSRFGYLRSDVPADPSPENQADALAELLDRLQIERLPVAGGSAGALPAAYFALRYPDRCSHLILLVPAANLTGRDPVEFTAFQRFIVERLLTSDLWYWSAATLAPRTLVQTLLATDPELLSRVSKKEAERANLILNGIIPVSERVRGISIDGRMAGSPNSIDFGAIRSPLLLISAEDDLFGTAETARIIAARVPTARLVIYPDGGHIWLGHDEDVADQILRFVADGAPI